MKSLAQSLVAPFIIVVGLCSTGAPAQGIYVSPGDNGPLFSNRPQPGAKEILLPPLTVVAPAKEVKIPPPVSGPSATNGPSSASERPSGAAALPVYRSFSIIYPENDGSVLANTAIFEVRVAIDPPLQIGEGHAVVVSVNGQPVEQRFTADEFMLPPELWTATLPPPNQRIQLDASIVDLNGQLLRKATPIRFFMRHATIRNRPQGLLPRPQAPPHAAPIVQPPRETVGGTTTGGRSGRQ